MKRHAFVAGHAAFAIAAMSSLPFMPVVAFDKQNDSGLDFKALEEMIKDRDSEALKALAAIELTTKGVKAQVDEIEQKLARGGGSDHGTGGKSLGAQFTESEGFKAFQAIPEASRRGHKADHIVKATITSLTTDAAGSAGAGVVPVARPLEALPQRRRVVRDLLPVIQISSGSVEIPVQKARTNNAAMVAEAAAKPASDLQLELKTFVARVIAHHMKASRQILDDVPQLRGLIDSELLYGLQLVEETQLLSGDNTGQNLYGMIPQATAYSAPFVVDMENMIDTVGLAMLQSALAECPADGVIMHPSDWMRIRLTKNAQGDYIYGDPAVAVEPRIFGQPVVTTQAMTIDKFLVGQFQRAATIFDRWEARVEVGWEGDDFIKNLVTLLGEERLAFAVTRPLALTYGDFGNV